MARAELIFLNEREEDLIHAQSIETLEKIGVKNVLFETDFPHPTALDPTVPQKIEKTLGHLDPATRKRILQDNAAELYYGEKRTA